MVGVSLTHYPSLAALSPTYDGIPITQYASNDFCSWYGVQCQEYNLIENEEELFTGNQIVTGLSLWGKELKGSIPSTLGFLSRLQWIDLSYNELTSTLPSSLGSMNSLLSLKLISNQLINPLPTHLGSLTNLQTLDLTSNRFTGTIHLSLILFLPNTNHSSKY